MISLITLNVVAVILESFQSIYRPFEEYFFVFELFSVLVFTLEYVLRLMTADLHYKGLKHPYLRQFFSFYSLVDLFSILPFYLPMILPFDLRFLRVLRVVRIFRVLKLNRYNRAMKLIGSVVKREKEALLMTVFIVILLLLLSSTMMYYVENEAQPDKFENILSSLWWAVATLTTVGYADIYPITFWGKVLSGAISILGIGLVALPTGIISSGFIGEVVKRKQLPRCPHCGKTPDDPGEGSE